MTSKNENKNRQKPNFIRYIKLTRTIIIFTHYELRYLLEIGELSHRTKYSVLILNRSSRHSLILKRFREPAPYGD